MRVIITGGTGLIGRALSDNLTADGHEVIVLSRNAKYVKGLPKGARAEQWDARTAAGWGHLADGADAVVNLAGESIAGEGLFSILFGRWSNKKKRRILDSRLNAGQAVVDAVKMAKKKPGVVIQSSAIGYYGTLRQQPLSEDQPAGFDFQARVCFDWEQATAAVDMMGVRRAVIRSGLVMSTRGGLLPVLLLPFKLFASSRLGSGKQWFPWVHIDDEVKAIRYLIENQDARGPFNITAPNPVTNSELTRIIRRVLRRPPFIPVPGFALRLMMGEKAVIVLEGARPAPAHLTDMGFTFKFTDFESALRDLLKK